MKLVPASDEGAQRGQLQGLDAGAVCQTDQNDVVAAGDCRDRGLLIEALAVFDVDLHVVFSLLMRTYISSRP